MTVQYLNTIQLREYLNSQIEEYLKKIENEQITKGELVELVLQLLTERSYLLGELDILKEIQEKLGQLSQIFQKDFNSLITLSEMDETLYNDFQQIAQKLGLSNGEVLSIMMKEFIEHFKENSFPQLSSHSLLTANRNLPVITVAFQDNLRITEQNLQDISSKISFEQINLLEFENVSVETFINKVEKIQDCKMVKVPSFFPRLLPYSKCLNCELIGFSESLSHSYIDYIKEANQVIENWQNGTEKPKD
ncbi:hypothetical protein [Candidatus Hodarchaeum mangrovi]